MELEKGGRPERILGMELKWEHELVALIQTNLIIPTYRLYVDSKMSEKKSLPTSRDSFENTKTDEEPRCDKTRYQAIVGSLLFIAWVT